MSNGNTAILQTVYQGGGVGPAPLNTYPPDYGAQALKSGPDALGYPVRACGSYAMWMMQATGRRTIPSGLLGEAADWPANVQPGWIIPAAVPGCVAIRPAVTAADAGHALFVLAVLPDGTLLTSSYNSDEEGGFALAIWATSGTLGGVPFTLTYIQFPPGDS